MGQIGWPHYTKSCIQPLVRYLQSGAQMWQGHQSNTSLCGVHIYRTIGTNLLGNHLTFSMYHCELSLTLKKRKHALRKSATTIPTFQPPNITMLRCNLFNFLLIIIHLIPCKKKKKNTCSMQTRVGER